METFSHQRNEAAGERFIDNADAVGDRFVLWDDGGAPVSMAMLRAPCRRRFAHRPGLHSAECARTRVRLRGDRRRVRIWPVASGVGDVVLFADLANPTSNGIYRQIGFEPVGESVRIDFAAAREIATA